MPVSTCLSLSPKSAAMLAVGGCVALVTLPARAQEAPAPLISALPPVSGNASRARIRNVVVTGAKVIPAQEVANAARAVVGRQGTSQTLREAVTSIVGLYRRRGFVMAQVTDLDVADDGQLRVTVAEGTIRQIILRGNRRTRARTLRAVLALHPGEVYQESAVRADRERLARLGIFADVTITPRVPGSPDPLDDVPSDKTAPAPAPSDPIGEGKTATPPSDPTPVPPAPTNPETPPQTPTPSGNQTPDGTPPAPTTPVPAEPLTDPDDVGLVDVIVRIKERPTANIAATLGYTDNIGAVGFVNLSEDNLLGTAHRVAVQWQRTASTSFADDGSLVAGDSRSAFGLSYDVPALRRSDLSFGGEVYDKNTVFLPYFTGGRDTIRSYERRRGGRVRVGRALFGPVAGFLTARNDKVGYSDLPNSLSPPRADVEESRGTVGALGFGLVADGRDQVGSPQSGYLHSVSVESARPILGGSFTFTQLTLDLRQYTPLGSARLAPNGKDKLPVPVFATRLYGGASSGYVPLSELFYLGGYDLLRGYDLYSLRGESAFLGTAELRLPVGQGLQAVAFTDIGGVGQASHGYSPRGLRAGVGAGLRFASPIGPIRLDAAYGNRLQTYVSLGQSF